MTIQEAIKTRKSFKRLGWTSREWLAVSSDGYHILWQSTLQIAELSVEDILAEDWEVKQ